MRFFFQHINAYMRVLRRRLITKPCPYHSEGIAFVDPYFSTHMIRDYPQFKMRPKNFKFNGLNYESVVRGLYPDDQKTGKIWALDVWHVYFVVHTGGDHWLALDVDMMRGHIDCYDSIVGTMTEEKRLRILETVKPFRIMIPYMLNDIIHPSQRSPS